MRKILIPIIAICWSCSPKPTSEGVLSENKKHPSHSPTQQEFRSESKSSMEIHEDQLRLTPDKFLVLRQETIAPEGAILQGAGNSQNSQTYSLFVREKSSPQEDYPIWNTFLSMELKNDLAVSKTDARLLAATVCGDGRVFYAVNFLGKCFLGVAEQNPSDGWRTVMSHESNNIFEAKGLAEIGDSAEVANIVSTTANILYLMIDRGKTTKTEYKIILRANGWSNEEVIGSVLH